MFQPEYPIVQAMATRMGGVRRMLALLLGLVLSLGALVFGPGSVTPAMAAAGDIACGGGYIYGVASGTANLTRINAGTGAATTIGAFGSGGTNINALGINAAGTLAYAMSAASGGSATMYTYSDTTGSAGATTAITGFNGGQGTFLAGAVDPSTGHYWVGGMVSNVFYAYSIDPTTGTMDSPAPRFTSAAGNFNADMAFDSKGNLYVAFSPSGGAGTLKRFAKSELSGNPTGSTLSTIPAAASGYPGMAFASDGYLYLTTTGTLRQIRPTDGSLIGSAITVSPGSTFSDLGSCATPTVVDAVQKNVVSRKASADQFTLELSGNGASVSATTSGTATGTQADVAGPVVVLPGQDYSVSEAASGGAVFANYLSTYQCVNTGSGDVIATGSGTSLTLTTPDTGSDGKGANITCTFTNEAKNPAIQIVKNASGSPTKADDQITYSFTVTNTGNRPLTGVAVTDPMLAPIAITCAATTLAVGASTSCTTATPYTVTQTDVEAGKVTNSATVAATPPAGEGAAGSVTDTDGKTVNIARTPQLKIVKAASGAPYAAGDQITYTFTLTNTGNVDITGAGVTDPKLASVTCPATSLAPGASTTCTAPAYTVTTADVTAGKVDNTAGPTGTSIAGVPTVDPASTPSVSVKLGTLPVAAPDTNTTPQNVDVDTNPLGNDTAGKSGAGVSGSLVGSSVVFTSAAATNGGRTLVVAGQGTYTVNATTGVVTFDPEPGFTGAATAVGYRVTDSLGHTATSTITITIAPINPDAVNDTASTPYLTPITVTVLGNDTAGASSAPLVPASVTFTSASATDGGKTLIVAGQGTYQIDASSGAVTFTPVPGFSGAATLVTYRLTDANGTPDTATLAITVNAPPAPSASPDTSMTLQNVDVQVDPVANDTASGGAILAPASVVFTSVAATNGGKTLVVAGEGTYTIDPSTGVVTFDPNPSFSGTATAVGYRIADDLGRTATSTITITVTGVHPAAAPDSALTPYRTPVTLLPLTNDTAGNPGAPLVTSSVVLTSAAATNGGKTLVVAGEGTWTVNADGTVTFAPLPGFTGPATDAGYRVYDTNGTSATASLAVTVGTPPTATPDTGTTPQNVTITLDPLSNDSAGTTGPTVGTLVGSSVILTSAEAIDGGRTLVVAGQGTWTVDPGTGAIALDPEPAFTGVTTAVAYAVSDSFGNTAASTITITVTGVAPNAADDANHTPAGTPVTTTVLANDIAGAPSAPLVPGSVSFTSPASTNGGKTLSVPGEGSYQANPDGSITFTPISGFAGATAPVTYSVADANGSTATASLAVSVGAAPAANPDLGTTPQDVNVSVSLLDNDVAGTDGAGQAGTLDPASVAFTSAAATNNGRSLVVTGQGSYTVDPSTGAATFDPEPTFTGPAAAVAYRVTDSYGHIANSTLTITVTAITPHAADDANHTPSGTPVTTSVLGNDTAGAPSAPLLPGSVVISTAGATADGKTLVVPGEGTWTVSPDGSIQFAPQPGFAGPATLAYQVSDSNGTPATANLTVTVGAPPSASDDLGSTTQNVGVTISPLGNDSAGDDGAGLAGTLDPTTLVFTAPTATNNGHILVVAGQGSYTINPTTGEVTFAPVPAFTGPATPIDYAVTDSFGNTAAAQIAITVTPVIPVAANDDSTTPYRTPVTVALLTNDAPGTAAAPLVPASVVFTSPEATNAGKTLAVPGQGIYELAADGTVSFTPAVGFTGTASSVGYTVSDANGTAATATVTITVTSPAAPSAADDANHAPYLTSVTTAVLTNDTAGGLTTLQPLSVVLTDPAAVNGGKTLVASGQGTYQVTPAGTIAFTPVAGFTGAADSIGYQVSDELGRTSTAHLVITVGGPPMASDDLATTPQNVPVTLAPLANDAAGDDGAGVSGGLLPSTVVFTSGSATDAGRTLVVAGQGTWTADPISGAVTFTPEPSFTGPTTPVAYAITDRFGNVATAREIVTVTPITPAATDDAATTPFGTPVTSTVLGNDLAGAPSSPLNPSSVRFVSPAATDAGTKLVVAGEGSYQVNPDGTVTFIPAPGFSGAATPVAYRVDDANGTAAGAALAITVGAPPAASDDSATTAYDTAVTLHPLGNDIAGDDGASHPGSLDTTSVVFTDPAAADGDRTLVIAEEGVWTVDALTGAVGFDPEPGFTGAATPVQYRVTDNYGHNAVANLTVTVGGPPVASDDATTTPQNVDVTLEVLTNDTAGGDGAGHPGTLDPSSVVFTSAAATNAGRTLVVDDEGIWTANGDGTVTFAPEPGFTGVATPTRYSVTDSFGGIAKATLRVTITPIIPVAANDAAHTPYLTPVTTAVLVNDTAGAASAPLIATSVAFTSADATDAGLTLVVPGQGTWTVNPAGTISFSPAAGFTGLTAVVDYRVADTNGTTATAKVLVMVGGPPAAMDDYAATQQNVDVTLDPLADDGAGDDGAANLGTLVPTSVVFTSAAATNAGKTLAMPGEGTWTVHPDGTVTFDPEATFTGPTTPVTYEVTDSFGNTGSADIHVTVAGIVPTASDDAATTPAHTPVTLPVLANDHAGAASAPLDATTVVFTSPDATDAGKTLPAPGEGTWTVNTDGSITLAPEDGFAGPATPVQYRLMDANGTPVAAVVRVVVGVGPHASDNAATTPQNVTVTLCPPCNDTAGEDGAGHPGTLDATSVVFTSAEATDAGLALVLPGEGTWTIDPATGAATFDPEPTFSGTTTAATYRITDSFGNTARATLQVTVTPVQPEAAPDSGNATFNTPVTIDVLGNDVAGDNSAPLLPSSVKLTSPDATNNGLSLVVPGEGTWTVNPDGTITFTPEPGFTGTTTPAAYEVTDTNGTVTRSTVAAVIGVGPAASADQAMSDTPGQPVLISVLGNDSGAVGCTLQPASLVILAGDPVQSLITLDVPGEGSWTANADGTLLFTPEAGFHGWSSWVTYGITDSCGNPTSAKVRAYEPTPTAVDSETDGGDGLAYTGAEVGGPLGVGVAFLILGTLVLVWRRRREA